MHIDLSAAWAKAQSLINGLIAALPGIAVALIVFALFCVAARTVRNLVRRLSERGSRHRNLGLVLGRLAQGTLIFVGLLVTLSIALPTFQARDLIQILGISSVAIGFAFKDIFQNFLAGILLLLTEPFRIGDQITFKSFEGTVEDIQTRATFIKTYDGRRVVVPNAELFTESVVVNTAFDVRRSEYDVGIGFGDDVEHARAVIRDTVRRVPGVLTEPRPDVLVVALADFSVNLRVWWWTTPQRAHVLSVQDQVLAAVKQRLTEEGIDLPFPTQQILFHDQTEETDGDRARQREGWPAGHAPVPAPRSVADALAALVTADRRGSHSDGACRMLCAKGGAGALSGEPDSAAHDSERRSLPS